MPATDLVSDGKTLKALRKQRGLTQEDLARALQLEVRTIQRWEAGDVKPSIQNIHQLNDHLRKNDWQLHPLHKLLLSQDNAVALLDGFAVYQKANAEFYALYHQFDNRQVEGEFAGDLFQFWKDTVERITGISPSALISSNITSIDYCMVDVINGEEVPLQHQVFIVRQKRFSTMLIHEVAFATAQQCAACRPTITRRTNK